MRRLRSRPMLLAAAVLVALAALPPAMRAAQVASWRVAESDRPVVERALGEAVRLFGQSPERYRRFTSPSVERRPGLTCVKLMSVLEDDGGSYIACYDANGGTVSERATVCSFGATSLADRVHAMLLGI